MIGIGVQVFVILLFLICLIAAIYGRIRDIFDANYVLYERKCVNFVYVFLLALSLVPALNLHSAESVAERFACIAFSLVLHILFAIFIFVTEKKLTARENRGKLVLSLSWYDSPTEKQKSALQAFSEMTENERQDWLADYRRRYRLIPPAAAYCVFLSISVLVYAAVLWDIFR